MKKLLITIDGPAGAGKTTVSRALADRLGYRYIDTGALYRGVALAAKTQGIDPQNDADLKQLCSGLELAFIIKDDGLRLISNGQDITNRIRTPEIAMLASAVSARPDKEIWEARRRLCLKVGTWGPSFFRQPR